MAEQLANLEHKESIKTVIWTANKTTTSYEPYYTQYGCYPAVIPVSDMTGYDVDIWARRIAVVEISAANTTDNTVTFPVALAGDYLKFNSFKPNQTFAVSMKVIYK